MKKPTCSTCPFYDADIDVTASSSYYNTPVELGNRNLTVIKAKGICRNLSVVQPHRKPEEWCGEHPAFKSYLEWWENERELEWQ